MIWRMDSERRRCCQRARTCLARGALASGPSNVVDDQVEQDDSSTR
jgi:hypothetical protein